MAALSIVVIIMMFVSMVVLNRLDHGSRARFVQQRDKRLVVSPQETWHDRYVEDNCNRCPECCIVIVEEDE